jgi:hypothetical protein
MRIICHRYGIKPEMVLGHRVSHESASNNPIHALKLSREGASDFVKTVIDGIRNIFKRLVVTIKKLFAKAVVIMSRTAKVAAKLAKKIENYDEAEAGSTFTESEVMSIASKLGATIIAEGGKLPKDPFATLNQYIMLLHSTTHIAIYSNVLKEAAGLQLNVLKAPAETAEEAGKKATEELHKKLADTNVPAVLKKVATAATAGKFRSPESGRFVPYAITGTKARVFIFTEDGHLKSATLNATPEALKTITIEIPSKASIISILSIIEDHAKKAKEYEAAALKETNDADTILANLAKETTKIELTPAAKRSITNYSTTVRVVTTNLGVDSILAHVSGTKAILAYCNIAARKLTKPNANNK